MDCAINGAGRTGVLQVDMRADSKLGRIARQKVGGAPARFQSVGQTLRFGRRVAPGPCAPSLYAGCGGPLQRPAGVVPVSNLGASGIDSFCLCIVVGLCANAGPAAMVCLSRA